MSQDETFLLSDGRRTSDLKVTELKKELEKLGKSKSGNKMELLNRLNESFSSKVFNVRQNNKENSVILSESSENQTENDADQASNNLCQDYSQDDIKDMRIVNIKNSTNVDVDLDASDELTDLGEVNQSVDALDLYIPLDDSLNVSETIREERLQIQLNFTRKDDSNCDEEEIQERTVICSNKEIEQIVLESSSDELKTASSPMKDSDYEIQKVNEHFELQPMENEVDDIENIELETQIEMYEVDNIDLDTCQMEMYEDGNKIDAGSGNGDKKTDDKPRKESMSTDSGKKYTESYSGDITLKSTAQEEAEEGEVVSIPITSRLGKRKVKEESNTDTSPKKPKKKGLKETKVTGYIVEGPERVQPPQKAKNVISDVLRIDNLVRPFTLTQLNDMLKTQGVVKDLWLNKIKSVAYVRYENEEIAINARENIDGCRWPSINNKLLSCDFVLHKEMEWMKEKGDTDAKLPQSLKPQIQHQQLTQHQQQHEQVKPVNGNERKPATVEKSKPSTINSRDLQKHESHKNQNNSKTKTNDDTRKRREHDHYDDKSHRRISNVNELRRRNNSPKDKIRVEPPSVENVREKSKEKVPLAVKVLEDIFRKTVTQPAIYWLPVPKEKKEEIMKKVG